MLHSIRLKRLFRLAYTLALLLIAGPISTTANELTVTDRSDTEIHVDVLPAQGNLLAIWLVDHVDERVQFENLIKAVNAAGIEVWRSDLLADYFLPRGSENVRTLSGDGVVALLNAAHRLSKKEIVLIGYDRLPLPLLRGAHQWIEQHPGESRLSGAVLFYPNLFGPPPVAGQDAELDPIVRATSIPITIYQPQNGTHRWRLREMQEGFESGGSQVFTYLVPGVRDWFFMHPPDQDPAERAATARVPKHLLALTRLMDALPKPTAVPPGEIASPPPSRVQELATVVEHQQAPIFDLIDVFGQKVRLDDYAGQVVLVNFWATWCPPCVEELPSLNKLVERYKERDFFIVSIDFRESENTIREFAKRVPVDFPVLIDSDGRISWAWKVFSFPSSFILDRSGLVRYSANRAIDWNTPRVWTILDALLMESGQRTSGRGAPHRDDG